MTDRADVAATLMEHLCDHDWHGYTQGGGRWGDGEGVCEVETAAGAIALNQGDRDCSSAVIDAWQEAIRGTDYEGVLDDATYTGNMWQIFITSGLFEWHAMGDGYVAQRGDIYLNHESHTAMCLSADPDILGEFWLNEWGGIVEGQVGDQTDWESRIVDYYDFPWNGILAYNHAADCEAPEEHRSAETQLFDINGTPAQKWWLRKDEDGYYTFVNAACGLALDMRYGGTESETFLWAYEPNGTDAQKFRVVQCEDMGYEPDGVAPWLVVPKLNDGLVMDCQHGGTGNGTRIWAYERNLTPAQLWTIVDHGDASWTFINPESMKALDVVNGGR